MENQLQKLKCKSLIDLLLIPPRRYENLYPISNLVSLPFEGVLKVSILSYSQVARVLKIRALMLDFGVELELLIFHPKVFHKKLFPLGETLYIHGVLQKKDKFEMIQPKLVKDCGKILPCFPKTALSNSKLVALTQELITQENLAKLGLPQEIIDGLLPIFHPNLEFFNAFNLYKSLPKKSLEALKFVEIFSHLQKIRTKKKDFPAKMRCVGDYQDFVSSLPFSLTQGQREAILVLSKDLQSPIAARRMIMGDVGCGKTIVILSAVMMAYPHKAILMAPTTILAQQLYEEALKFLPSKVRIGLFKGDLKSKKQSYEDFDFVIGTQALLYKCETLEDFALVMSDEQHRFGTLQRHTLEKLASSNGHKPHILQFSATPIPRTMAMLQSELIAHTFITDTPFKKDIDTFIVRRRDFSFLLAHIKEEIAKNHQVAIVYPLVEESEHLSYLSLKESESYWFKNFEGVYSTNGSDKNKDEVLADFRDKGSILLSTTVIEVGISLPRLSTIVIVGAERMGLSTLHQLRGRVSRNGLKGYCFLFTHQERFERLSEFAKSKNGFEIAEIDLKYRKSGDLLEGKNQSGDEFRFFDPICDAKLLQKAKEVQTKTSYNPSTFANLNQDFKNTGSK